MGLPIPLLRFLVQEHVRRPFQGTLLTLGRQCVYATVDELCAMLRKEGVEPATLPPDLPLTTNIPQWRNTPREKYASDVVFFRLLGLADVSALDFSAFEGAEHVVDLNQPVSQDWEQRCDVIIDSGTLEHVFHLPNALTSLSRMLRPGGRIIHFSPANNYTNHGFYQLCPTLFRDYYRQNRFGDVRVYVAEQESHRNVSAPMTVYTVDEPQPELMMSRRRLLSIAVATKTTDSTCGEVPLQSFYSDLFTAGKADVNRPTSLAESDSWRDGLRRVVPVPIKTWVRRIVPGFDPVFRPWRLKKLRRFR